METDFSKKWICKAPHSSSNFGYCNMWSQSKLGRRNLQVQKPLHSMFREQLACLKQRFRSSCAYLKEFSSCDKPQQIFCWDRTTFCIVFGLCGKSHPTLVFLSPAHRTASPSSALAPIGFILLCLGCVLSPPISSLDLFIYHLGTWPHTF